MAYKLYMNGVLYPITPSNITIKVGNKNKTINLINEGEVNLLKSVGLTSVEFDLLLPNVKYPFAKYEKNYEPAKYFLDKLFDLKANKKSFQFIVVRTNVRSGFYDTNLKMSLEDLTIKEDADNGFDVLVGIKLKEYKEFGTKVYEVEKTDVTKTTKVEEKRTESDNKPKVPTTYTIKKGDTLCKIAKYFYGDSSLYGGIVTANNIKNPDLIITGHKLQIPATGVKYVKPKATATVENPPYSIVSTSGVLATNIKTKAEAISQYMRIVGSKNQYKVVDKNGKVVYG